MGSNVINLVRSLTPNASVPSSRTESSVKLSEALIDGLADMQNAITIDGEGNYIKVDVSVPLKILEEIVNNARDENEITSITLERLQPTDRTRALNTLATFNFVNYDPERSEVSIDSQVMDILKGNDKARGLYKADDGVYYIDVGSPEAVSTDSAPQDGFHQKNRKIAEDLAST